MTFIFIKSLLASLYERKECPSFVERMREISQTCSFYLAIINKNNALWRELITNSKYFHGAVMRQIRSI